MEGQLKHEITDYLIEARLDLGVDFLGIALDTSETSVKEIKWLFASGNRNNRYQKIVLQNGKGIAGIVWKTGRAMSIQNLREEVEDLSQFPIAIMENLVSIVAIPILVEQEVLAIFLGGYRKETVMDERIKQQMDAVAEKLSPYLLQFMQRKED
ncbi:GAF domain-containing protein [Listeria kieliensis]|uniref:GAF domain-containing protein n=1 Tax=Listeria kieliensis TaxID=1621700 RepID=UPI000E213D5D|nr:GAF domain-containing protein [Listeria kieliensis]